MKKNIVVSDILTFIIFFGMVSIAEIFDEKEIIFPEAAALCAGALLAPVQPWSVSKPRFVLIMTICSTAGLGLSLVTIPLILKVMAGFLIAVVCINVFRCSLVPAISACVLPVLMNTRSIIYPISVFVLALCTVLFQLFLEKLNLRKQKEFEKTEPLNKKAVFHWLIMFACILVYSIYPTTSGNVLLIAPPLIVMFCEMMSDERKFFKKEHTLCIFVIICAVVGSMCNFAAAYFNISAILCGAVVSVIIILLMNIFKIYFPPAAALAFLPFIVSEDILLWYPLFVAITAIVISVTSAIVSRVSVNSKNNILMKK